MRSNLGIKIWDYRWFAFTSFAFLFRKRKYVKEKKQLVQDLIPPLHIYIHMCTLYTHTNICMSFSPSGFFGPSRCLIPTLGLTSKHPICAVCVCVCVYTHSHTHTLPPALKKEKTQTTPWCNLNLEMISPGSRTRDFTVIGRYNYRYAVSAFIKSDERTHGVAVVIPTNHRAI